MSLLFAERSHFFKGSAVDFFLNFLPLDVAERASNILVDKHFSDLLPKGAGNFECQPQVWVKPTLSMELIVWRVTPTWAASFAWDHSRSARSTRRRVLNRGTRSPLVNRAENPCVRCEEYNSTQRK
jgi:hypothetical protein